ncbi:hypothetical protein ZHAS_00013078 [Anopheles sinensis]|uniref:Uncharacterized protein n=1 Tax=Anopheles sinensis TaxID=74873 RepID=A0A084W4U7_ANOSI|nr:hypothetical protein ZHAS_00013078 [Anopheles sinensis]
MMDSHNALISKLIADEAIKMLSSAASSRAPTSLNEPSEDSESISSPTAGSSNDTNDLPPTGPTTTTKPATNKATFAADSALLQKSAEQVTRKLINQLTTMNKYNLKQMIDNPAGKYETALNKHAQNKLRAEVRKQLKNFTLADAVRAKESNFGSDVLAPDEAIDAEKIPAALLEQIGHALDLDFFDLASSDPREAADADPESVITIEDDNQPSSADKPVADATNNQAVNVQDKENGISSSFASSKTQATEDVTRVFPVAIFPSQPAAVLPEEEPGKQTLISTQEQPWISSFLHVNSVYELNKRLETNTIDVGQTSQTPIQISVPVNETQVAKTNSTTLSNGNEIGNDSQGKSTNDLPVTGSNTTSSLDCQSKRGTNNVLPSTETPKRIVKPKNTVTVGSKKIPQPKLLASNANATPAEAGKQTNITIQKQPSVTQTTSPVAETTQGTIVDQAIVALGGNEQTPRKGKKKQKKKNKKNPTQLPVAEGNGNGNATITSPKPKPNRKPGTGTPRSLPWSPSRWVVIGVTPELVQPEESSLRTKSPEPIPISSRYSPRKEGGNFPKEQCNSNGKRTWNGSSPGNKNHPQPPFKGRFGNSPKGKQEWNGAKKSRGLERSTPIEGNSKEANTRKTNIHSISYGEASQPIVVQPVNAKEPNPTGQEKRVFPTPCSEPQPSQPIIVNGTNSKEQNGNQENTVHCMDACPSTGNIPPNPPTCQEANPSEENVVQLQNSNDKQPSEENTVHPQLENGSDIRISEVRSLAEKSNENMAIADASLQPTEDFKTTPLVDPTEHTEATVPLSNDDVQASTPCHSERFLYTDNSLFATEQPDMPTTMLPELTSAQQPLVMILDRMQSIDAQTVELFKRKMEIDGQIMKLNGERMEIDQEIVKLQNAREEQMNTLRFAMFIPQNAPAVTFSQNSVEPNVSNGSADNQPHPLLTVRTDLISREDTKHVISSSEQEPGEVGPTESPTENTQQQSAVNQERTIRRITKISGNSDLMRIFQRRRLLSDRSSDDNAANENGVAPSDLPTV